MADPETKPDKNQEAPKVAPAAAPAETPKAPAAQRADIIAPTQDALSDLGAQNAAITELLKMPEFSGDAATQELVRNFMSRIVVPGKGWDDFRKQWLAEAMVNVKKTPTLAGLEAVFGANGNPGPFGKWLEKHADKDKIGDKIGLWKMREASRETLAASKKNPLLEALDAKINGLHNDFTALKIEAQAIREKVARAPAGNISPLEAETAGMTKLIDAATTAHTAFVAASQDVEGLNYGKDALKSDRDLAGNLLKAVKDDNSLSAASKKISELQAGVERWKKLETAANNPDLPSERRDEILNATKTNNKSPEDALAAVERAVTESQTASLAQTGEKPGLYDQATSFLASWNMAIESPALSRAALKLAVILASIPFIGKTMRGLLFNRTGLLHLARVAGNKLEEAQYTQEIYALGRIKKYGISAATANKLMDLNAASFAQIQAATLTDNDAERLAILTLQRKFAGSGLATNPKEPVWKIIGCSQWLERVTPPEPIQQTPEKTPAQKTEELLKDTIGFTPDQIVKVQELTVSAILQGNATYPDGTPDDKKAKLKAILEKNIPESERANVKSAITVKQFLENRYQNKQTVEV